MFRSLTALLLEVRGLTALLFDRFAVRFFDIRYYISLSARSAV